MGSEVSVINNIAYIGKATDEARRAPPAFMVAGLETILQRTWQWSIHEGCLTESLEGVLGL